MRQIFLLILLFIVGQWLVKALRRVDARTAAGEGAARTGSGAGAPGAGATRASSTRGGGNNPPQLAEPMIRCAECGVHAPKSDSVLVAGETFCSADHAHRHAVRTGTNRRDAR